MQYYIKNNTNICLSVYLSIYLSCNKQSYKIPPSNITTKLASTLFENDIKQYHQIYTYILRISKPTRLKTLKSKYLQSRLLNHIGIKMDRTLHYFNICLTNQQQYYNRFQAYNIIMNSKAKIQQVLSFEILSQLGDINITIKSQQNKYYLDSKSMYNMQIDFIFGLVQKATKMSQIQQLCNMQIDFSTNKTLKSQQNKSYLRSKCINQTCKNQQNKSYLN
eukprot:TRINITY_DN2677_c0_g1_i6.p4 TRINITY_DN2677_c0_g1~~TRINITY_DN2677_c0_g1_i6.p4  ORF type:complete len:220 (-),score=-21.85 TRINITY_DN2677_c0_g1_i6:148-807(-)